MIRTPEFKTKSELFRWIKANKALIMTEKKAQLKFADPFTFQLFTIAKEGGIEKADANPALLDLNEFNVKVAINTTNFLDTCNDVHIPGLWKKSLSETKILYLLQEHKMQFDHIITDRVQASAKMMNWKDLGFDYPGMSEVLVFDCQLEKSRNPFMCKEYALGRVKNHSVGMRYVKIELAMNSEYQGDAEEKAVWDKYYPQIVNPDTADQCGYFFAVTEAKVIEGSAVPLGANSATPTISISEKSAALESAGDDATESKPLFGLKFLSNN